MRGGGSDTQRLQLCADRLHAVAILVFALEMMAIDAGLFAAHRHADDMAMLLHQLFANVLL